MNPKTAFEITEKIAETTKGLYPESKTDLFWQAQKCLSEAKDLYARQKKHAPDDVLKNMPFMEVSPDGKRELRYFAIRARHNFSLKQWLALIFMHESFCSRPDIKQTIETLKK